MTQQKRLTDCEAFSAERAGFEYHPLNGGARSQNKNASRIVRRFQRRGRDLNIIPSMGARVPKTRKRPTVCEAFSAERAGFEYHPLNGGARSQNKKTPR